MAVSRNSLTLFVNLTALDAILHDHAGALGGDFDAYRNHAHRVAHLCLTQTAGSEDQVQKITIAAAFHDLGIWTARTFDYLPPSVELARAYLARAQRADWIPEVTEMILMHHKISPHRRDSSGLVEAFRRADWMDVSLGIVTFGLPRTLLETLVSRWPRAGFHKRLVQLELRRLRTHPWNPLPMVKL